MTVCFERPEAHPHVAVVVLDRPERANALDLEMLRQLAAAWRRIDDDPSVRVVVLTGAGDRSFCAGMDMRETIPASQALARGERIAPEDFEGLQSVAAATLVEKPLRVPLIAAINGHARAGGFDLLLAAQIRYAVPSATFALEEVALGLYPTG
ncbi:MAG TPA: enoyl-CoA hydratase/isomerase family protein, partial [Myxococcota bacterium]|nr:enoyl-CoA hydratase/isomerase family protein [Myxococcota bacterium]